MRIDDARTPIPQTVRVGASSIVQSSVITCCVDKVNINHGSLGTRQTSWERISVNPKGLSGGHRCLPRSLNFPLDWTWLLWPSLLMLNRVCGLSCFFFNKRRAALALGIVAMSKNAGGRRYQNTACIGREKGRNQGTAHVIYNLFSKSGQRVSGRPALQPVSEWLVVTSEHYDVHETSS